MNDSRALKMDNEAKARIKKVAYIINFHAPFLVAFLLFNRLQKSLSLVAILSYSIRRNRFFPFRKKETSKVETPSFWAISLLEFFFLDNMKTIYSWK